MSTIPVHIQTTIDDAKFFANWPLDQLDDVIPLLSRWDLADSDGDYTSPAETASGEFAHDGRQIIFRISVGEASA